VVIAGVLAFVMARFLFPPATVDLSQINRDIAFTSDRDNGQWGIYTINPDGEITRLSPLYQGDAEGDCTASNRGQDHCAFDYFPSYSFDGEMINFLTNRNGTEMGPAQVRPDGTDFRVLGVVDAVVSVMADNRFDWDPQWSQTGRLGWSKIAGGNLEIYVEQGAGELRFTADGLNGPRDWFLSWSPDGAVITFSSNREGTENVYRVAAEDIASAEGPGDITLEQITNNPVDDFHPAWALDGDQILFVSDLDDSLLDGVIQLFLMNPDGSDQQPIDEDRVFRGDPVYSADGSQMVYVSNESGTWSLYLQDTETGESIQLTDDSGDDLFPVWGPVPADAN